MDSLGGVFVLVCLAYKRKGLFLAGALLSSRISCIQLPCHLHSRARLMEQPLPRVEEGSPGVHCHTRVLGQSRPLPLSLHPNSLEMYKAWSVQKVITGA